MKRATPFPSMSHLHALQNASTKADVYSPMINLPCCHIESRLPIIALSNKGLEGISKINLQKVCCLSLLPSVRSLHDACQKKSDLEKQINSRFKARCPLLEPKIYIPNILDAGVPNILQPKNYIPSLICCTYKEYELKISMAGIFLHV